MVCWHDLLKQAFAENKEKFSEMKCTLSRKEMHRMFDDGYGTPEGTPFTAWGERYVYFPVCYDGAEWVGCAPRNPCKEATEHVGGS